MTTKTFLRVLVCTVTAMCLLAPACDSGAVEIDGCGDLIFVDGGCVFPDAGDASTGGADAGG